MGNTGGARFRYEDPLIFWRTSRRGGEVAGKLSELSVKSIPALERKPGVGKFNGLTRRGKEDGFVSDENAN